MTFSTQTQDGFPGQSFDLDSLRDLLTFLLEDLDSFLKTLDVLFQRLMRFLEFLDRGPGFQRGFGQGLPIAHLKDFELSTPLRQSVIDWATLRVGDGPLRVFGLDVIIDQGIE